MMILNYLRLILLSLYWQLPLTKVTDLKGQTHVVNILNRREVKRKRLKKKRQRLPIKQKKNLGHQKFRKTKAKDARFSDQKKLRRMYRGI